MFCTIQFSDEIILSIFFVFAFLHTLEIFIVDITNATKFKDRYLASELPMPCVEYLHYTRCELHGLLLWRAVTIATA